jgi:hypothetical protein
MKGTPQRDNLNATPKPLPDLFVMQKGTMTARCELWTHGFGWECRLFAGGEILATQVCRSDREIEDLGKRGARR